VLLPSGTVAVSGVFTPGSTTEFFTAAFAADGTPQWTNGLPDSIGQAWKIFQLNDGTLLSLGDFENHTGTNDVLAQRYSPAGALLGQVVIDSPGLNNGDDLGDATMDAEGNVYLTGTFSTAGQAKPGLARLTPSGALDWWVTYPVPAAWNGFGLRPRGGGHRRFGGGAMDAQRQLVFRRHRVRAQQVRTCGPRTCR
jgi:hypothetical protein